MVSFFILYFISCKKLICFLLKKLLPCSRLDQTKFQNIQIMFWMKLNTDLKCLNGRVL